MGDRGGREGPNAGGQHAGKGGGAEALARYKMYEYRAVREDLRRRPIPWSSSEWERRAHGWRDEGFDPIHAHRSCQAYAPLPKTGNRTTGASPGLGAVRYGTQQAG
jgi:hypothetical protein